MNRIKVLKTAVMVIIFSSCANGGLMNGIMESWQGQKISEAILQLGVPSKVLPLNDVTIYEWDSVTTYTPPERVIANTDYQQSSTVTGNQVGTSGSQATSATIHKSQTYTYTCVRSMQVSSDGIITKTSHSGRNCPIMELGKYSRWRYKP